MTFLSRKLTLLFVLFLSFIMSAFPQQSVYEKGLQLYNQKKYNEVIEICSEAVKQEDAEKDDKIWYILGLSYIQVNSSGNAHKALRKAIDYNPVNADYRTNLAYVSILNGRYDEALFESEKAISLDPQNEKAHYYRGLANLSKGEFEEAISDANRLIAINPTSANAYILKSDSFLYGYEIKESQTTQESLDLLKQAADSLNLCLDKCSESDRKFVEDKLETINIFYDYFVKRNRSPDEYTENNPNFTNVKILSKPRPGYTDLARSRRTEGTITLAVLLDKSGKVGRILVLRGLPNGLTENTTKAFEKIEFEPARESGKPVSIVKFIQFGFTIY